MEKAYKIKWSFLGRVVILVVIAILGFQGCDIYEYDGNSDSVIIDQGGYFYLLERESNSLILLNSQLKELKRWGLTTTIEGTSTQGITYDGTNLWISSAGTTDKIFQIDISGDSIVVLKSFDAPPQKRGTVRDLAFDGNSLWAMNSGSSTYKTPATLYELNPSDGSIRSEYVLPNPEPRGLTYVTEHFNVYGSGPGSGLYFSDSEKDYIYYYRYDRPRVDTIFSTPVPVRGNYTRYIAGITHDGRHFWLVNSSDVSDILYKAMYNGVIIDQYELPYKQPGPIVWAPKDLRESPPPAILALTPASGVIGSVVDVDIYGTGFKPGAVTVSFGAGITVNQIEFKNTSLINVKIEISPLATPGKRDVTVTNPDGSSAKLDTAFEVTQTLLIPYLWVADQASGQTYLYKIRLTDTTVVQEWATEDVSSAGIQGVAYDGTDIWLCASSTIRTIYKVDVSGISIGVKSSFAVPVTGGTLRGIFYDNGTILMAVSSLNSAGYIFRLNANTGAIIDTIQAPGAEPRGITLVAGQLYCNDTAADSVYIYNSVNKSWTGIFATPTPAGGSTSNRFATGLTHDGQSFWIANSSGDYDHIYRVSETGVVLRSFEAPRKGAAQITGIVYVLSN
ncbi:MAG: hypothetical protein GX452_09815 [Ignavibacteriales bacterium]|nr:hypothetical protein [Ignavibacteriales bacterium]